MELKFMLGKNMNDDLFRVKRGAKLHGIRNELYMECIDVIDSVVTCNGAKTNSLLPMDSVLFAL